MPTAQVLETRRLTPQMIRVVFGGEELSGFGAGEFTDHYVKLRITAGAGTRTYTVREWDGERLTIDFVVHGDEGVAGPWAAAAQPGDELRAARARRRLHARPGRRLAPDGRRRRVIPAIAASLAAHPRGRARPRAGRGRRPGGGAAAQHARRPAPALAARRRRARRRRRGARLPARRRPRVRARRGERRARSCAATCSSTAACRARRSRSPATGSARAPRKAGARTRRSGTASSSRTPPPSSSREIVGSAPPPTPSRFGPGRLAGIAGASAKSTRPAVVSASRPVSSATRAIR